MQRKILPLLLFCLGSVAGFCQVPGYLGKKLTFQGEIHSFPALSGPTSKGHGLDYVGDGSQAFGLNWSAGARLGYVVSRYSQVVLSFDYLKTGMVQTVYIPNGFDYNSPEMFFNLTGLNFGIGNRKYRSSKGGLAPMGMYSGYSLNAILLKGKTNEKLSSYNATPAELGIDPKHMLLSFGYEIGTNFILKDRFLLNVGAKLNFAISPRAVRYVLAEEGGWDPYSNNQGFSDDEGNTDNFKSAAAARYALHSVFMIYLGVGLTQ